MRWYYLVATALFASLSQAASAENDEIVIEPVPEWVVASEPLAVPEDPQGAAFFRQQDTIAHLTEDGAYSFQSQTIRILSSQALQAGNIAIAWNPAAGPAAVHSLKIRRGSRVIDVLEQSSFEILRREDMLEQAMLTGMLTAVLQVPDLRVGDDLELSYTVPLHDPTLRDVSHGLLFLSEAPPQGRFRLRLSWEDGQEPSIRLTDDFKQIASRTDNAISLDFDNPDIVSAPRFAPPRYAWNRVLEFSDFEGWSGVSSRFHQLYASASAVAPDSPLQEEIAIIAESHASDFDRMQAALKLVQQQVRYIYIGLNGGNLTPASAEETWQRRYGDCKGKTALLLALLAGLGIDAEGVLVSNALVTDGLDTKLPNPALFDHIIVRATIDGETYYLDGTLPEVIEARPDPFLPYQWILPLSETGSDPEELERNVLALPQEIGLFQIDASAGFDEPAKRVHTTISRGATALQEYLTLTSVSPSQLTAALQSNLAGSALWDNIEAVDYRFDRETQASILTITGTGPVDWENDGSDGFFLRLPGGGFSPPSRRSRAGETDGDIPFYQAHTYACHVVTLTLPDDTDLTNWTYNSTIDTMLYGRIYYRMMELREDRTLRMVRGSRVEMSEIGVSVADRDNGRLSRFDNSMAVIGYDPSTLFFQVGGGPAVPATDEADWAGVNPPCLPKDVLED